MLLKSILRKLERISYLKRAVGIKGSSSRIIKKIIAPIYLHVKGRIIVRNVKEGDPTDSQAGRVNQQGVKCIVLETLQSLLNIEDEIPALFPIKILRRHMELGQGGIVILALQPQINKEKMKVIGYRTGRRGVFIMPGLDNEISRDVLFIIETQVLPKYRGQRIQQAIRAATYEYCKKKGIKKICGVVMAHNLPSIIAHTRCSEDKIIGTIEVLSILSGIIKKVTSWEKIAEALDS